MSDIRKVQVRAYWESLHTVEIPADAPKIVDIDEVIEYGDIRSDVSQLMDWEISDDGPSNNGN